jgi:transcription antitermination factor NusG
MPKININQLIVKSELEVKEITKEKMFIDELKFYTNLNSCFYGYSGTGKTTHALYTLRNLKSRHIIPQYAFIDLDGKDKNESMVINNVLSESGDIYVSSMLLDLSEYDPIDIVESVVDQLEEGSKILIDCWNSFIKSDGGGKGNIFNNDEIVINKLNKLLNICNKKNVNILLIAHSTKQGVEHGVSGSLQFESKFAYMLGFDKKGIVHIQKDSNSDRVGKEFRITVSDGTYITDRTTITSTVTEKEPGKVVTDKEERDMYKLDVLRGRVAQVGKRLFTMHKDKIGTNVAIKYSVFKDIVGQIVNIDAEKEDILTPSFIKINLPLVLNEYTSKISVRTGEKRRPIEAIVISELDVFLEKFTENDLNHCNDNWTLPTMFKHLISDSILLVETEMKVKSNTLEITDKHKNAIFNLLKSDNIKKRILIDNMYKNSDLFTQRSAKLIVDKLVVDKILIETKVGKAKLISKADDSK